MLDITTHTHTYTYTHTHTQNNKTNKQLGVETTEHPFYAEIVTDQHETKNAKT